MEVRNAVFGQNDAIVDCEVNHPSLGWIPFTTTQTDTDPFVQEVWAAVQSQEIAPKPIPDRAIQRENALARIDQVHAEFLRNLTGNATIEERDTWKTKEEAARALIAGTASEGQVAMINFEAQGDGTDSMVLAQTIIAKAEAFQALIGIAAGLKIKAKTEITQATDETIPVEQVQPGLEAIFIQLSEEAEQAATRWRSATKQ